MYYKIRVLLPLLGFTVIQLIMNIYLLAIFPIIFIGSFFLSNKQFVNIMEKLKP